MDNESLPYRSYLLRLWYAQSADNTVWRASLEDPHTGERIGFATPDQLFEFLVRPPPPGENERPPQ